MLRLQLPQDAELGQAKIVVVVVDLDQPEQRRLVARAAGAGAGAERMGDGCVCGGSWEAGADAPRKVKQDLFLLGKSEGVVEYPPLEQPLLDPLHHFHQVGATVPLVHLQPTHLVICKHSRCVCAKRSDWRFERAEPINLDIRPQDHLQQRSKVEFWSDELERGRNVRKDQIRLVLPRARRNRPIVAQIKNGGMIKAAPSSPFEGTSQLAVNIDDHEQHIEWV